MQNRFSSFEKKSIRHIQKKARESGTHYLNAYSIKELVGCLTKGVFVWIAFLLLAKLLLQLSFKCICFDISVSGGLQKLARCPQKYIFRKILI